MKRDIDKFHLMKVLNEVVTHGSFTKAALELKMPVSSVSKAVQQLESSLNTKLLHRTTRSLSLTDSGNTYFAASRNMLNQLQDLEEKLTQQGDAPVGLLKVAAPTALGQCLIVPKIISFMEHYPQVKVELTLTENLIDITEQGFDLVIRSRDIDTLAPLYKIELGTRLRKLVASPKYLDKHSLPNSPDALKNEALLNYKGPQVESHWQLSNDEKTVTVFPQAVYTSNNYDSIHQAALSGLGIANLYQYLIDEDIRTGRLIHVLPQWQQESRSIYGIYQQRRDTSAKLDAFLSFITPLF